MQPNQDLARLQERCHELRDTLRTRALATDEELDAYWPGGSENESETLWGWIHCYGNYGRFLGRLEHRLAERSPDEIQRRIVDAVADTPADVIVRGPDGTPKTVSVYAKGFRALEWVLGRTRRIEWLIAKRLLVAARNDADALDLCERIDEEIAYQYVLLAWAATTPGPWLPWEPGNEPHDFPDWAQNLTATDVLAIRAAFQEVNVVSIAVLHQALSPRTTKQADAPMSWGELFAMRSTETGIATTELLRDRSLRSEIVAALASGHVRERMDAASKTKP